MLKDLIICALVSIATFVVCNTVYNKIVLEPLLRANTVDEAVAKSEKNAELYVRLDVIKSWACILIAIWCFYFMSGYIAK